MKKKTLAIITALTVLLFSLFALTGCLGQNGQDGKDFDLYSVYQQLVEQGEFNGTYSEFVKQYLNVEVEWNEGSSLSTAINTSLSGVVSIVMSGSYSYSSTSGGFWGNSKTETTTLQFSGSGVIYSLNKEEGDAYVITNCHVIYPGAFTEDGIKYTPVSTPKYTAYLYGLEMLGMDSQGNTVRGNQYAIDCTLVGYSMTQDVAVLKIEDSEVLKNSMAQAVTMGDSDELAVGGDVFLIGNAVGEGISATAGIVSVESEDVYLYAADGVTLLKLRSIRTDSAANHGNSGGGMFDRDGKLVGILFSGYEAVDAQGIGNCLPVSAVRGVADSIIENCDGDTVVTTSKAVMGITVYTESVRQVYDEENNKFGTKESVVIETVNLASAADGALQAGDRILALSLGDYSVEVTHQWNISDFLWRVRSDDTISVTVLRGSEEVTEQITFGESNFVTVQ